MSRLYTKTAIFIIPLLVSAFVHVVNGNVIQKVIYQDGAIEDHDISSSSSEEIPPREEWFRVRGSLSLIQPRSQAIVHEAGDIVALPSTRAPARIIENIMPGHRGSSNFETDHSTREGNGDGQSMQVQVRNHGRVGFQKKHEPNRFQSGGEDEWEMTKLPSTSTRKGQQNRYVNIRHESGNREITDDDSTESVTLNNQRRQPSIIERSNQIRTQDEQVQLSEDDEDTYYEDNDDKTEKALPIRTSSSQRRINPPPPHDQVAKMARYIVRNSNWTSMATISTRSPVKGYPFANVFSVSDGPENNSSGIPYMYLTPLDMSVSDLKNDSRASLTMSLAQSDYCVKQHYDQEDPRCAHVILTGKVAAVENSNEIQFAQKALYDKHPEMQGWPKDHGWFFAKLQMENIIVLDYFGGAKTAALEDYFNQSML